MVCRSGINTAEQSMQSVLSTALSRLNAFLDSELEQILCFDTAIDAEMFCKQKTAIFLVMPEEDNTKYFIISLILQQLYREILAVADENGGKLDNRVMFFWDEVGTIPKIESAEMMFSAIRSRRVSIVAMIQSFAQLQKNYGKEGAEIIVDNCQDTIFGGFAPNSESAEVLSKNLGNRTVLSGSVNRGKNDPSQSLQMMQRSVMTADELKSLPKGNFIVAKTGAHPMRTKLKLFLKWGITFEEPYEVEEKAARKVAYADKREIEEEIIRRYMCCMESGENVENNSAVRSGGMQQNQDPSPAKKTTADITHRRLGGEVSKREIYKTNLPHRAIAVYLYLESRANKDRICYPAIGTIARELHLSVSTVKRAITDLERRFSAQETTLAGKRRQKQPAL